MPFPTLKEVKASAAEKRGLGQMFMYEMKSEI